MQTDARKPWMFRQRRGLRLRGPLLRVAGLLLTACLSGGVVLHRTGPESDPACVQTRTEMICTVTASGPKGGRWAHTTSTLSGRSES